MNNKLIKIKFRFQSGTETDIFGEIYFPFINDHIYQPYKIMISRGITGSSYKKLRGLTNQYKFIKNKLIKDYFKPLNMSEQTFKVDQEFKLNDKPMGLVKMMSILNGYSSNRSGNLLVDDNVHGWENKKIAELFRNLKRYKNNINNYEVISLSEISENKSFQKLITEQYNNIKSTTEMEVRYE